MRTNRQMRNQTDANIRTFFTEAQKKLSKPQWAEVAKPFIASLHIDPEIHWAFYDNIYEQGVLQIKDWGSVHFTLPKYTYGYISGLDNDPHKTHPKCYHSDYSLIAKATVEELDEATQRYVRQHSEMHQASKAMREGAAEALKELTMERALTRLPEMKRFLPEGYRNG